MFRKIAVASLGLAFWGTAAFAAGPPTIAPEDGRRVAEDVARLVERNYLYPDRRSAIAGAIREKARENRYDTEEPEELVERLTADLRAAGRDRHLYVTYDPDLYRDLVAHGDDESGSTELSRAIGKRRNQGFEELKILDRNIRYARITNFLWSEGDTAPVIDEAARFLGEGAATIVDLRGNGGGSPESVERLVSYFLPEEGRPLIGFFDVLTGETKVARAARGLPHPRILGKPLFVLTDGGTASAAEEFAYHVRQFKLGTILGEKTAGAANRNRQFPVAPGFVASVSIGRPIHVVGGSSWEGTGVAPDVEAPSATALDEAELLALRLLPASSAEDRALAEWAMEGIEARLRPPKPSEAELREFTGRFGIRTIRLEKGSLAFQREGNPPTTLIPMGPDLFAFANTADVRVRFRRSDRKVVGFDQVTADGQVFPSDRTE